MADPILTALPSIHVTLVGFVGAFVCAFGVYAFQKIHEITDAKQRLVQECKDLVCAVGLGDGKKFLNDDGTISWRAVSSCIKETRLNGAGITDARVEEAFEDLLSLVGVVFHVYPFLSHQDQNWQMLDDAVILKKNGDLDAVRLQDLQDAVGQLTSYFRGHEATLWEITNRYMSIRHNREARGREESFQAILNSFPDPTPDQVERLRQKYMVPKSPEIDFTLAIKSTISVLDSYSGWILPRASQIVRDYNKWNSIFPLREMSLFMFWSAVVVLVFGVFAPPVVLWAQEGFNLCNDRGWCWSKWYSLVLLLVTSAPYFAVGAYWWWKYRIRS